MAACLLARDHSAPSPPPAYSRRADRGVTGRDGEGGPICGRKPGRIDDCPGPRARATFCAGLIADSRVGSSAREPGRKDQPGPAPTSEQRATLPESEMAILHLPGLRICRSTALSAKLAPRPSASHVAGRSSGSGFGFFSGRRNRPCKKEEKKIQRTHGRTARRHQQGFKERNRQCERFIFFFGCQKKNQSRPEGGGSTPGSTRT